MWHCIFEKKLFTCISWDTLTYLTSTFPFKNPLHHRIVPSFRGTNWHILHQKKPYAFLQMTRFARFSLLHSKLQGENIVSNPLWVSWVILAPKTFRISPKSIVFNDEQFRNSISVLDWRGFVQGKLSCPFCAIALSDLCILSVTHLIKSSL